MKKLSKTIVSALLTVLCCMSIIMPVQAKTDKLALNYKTLTMQVGEKVDFNVTDDSFVKSSKKVTWISSDKKVATVDKNGVVTAKKTGKVTITAKTKDKKEKAACKVTVKKKAKQETKVLVAYFSCTNTTKGVAEKIVDAPHIIDTFMESYDFSGKTIVPFCTSGSSGIGSSAKELHDYTDSSVTWLEGARLPSSTSKEDMADWIRRLSLGIAVK